MIGAPTPNVTWEYENMNYTNVPVITNQSDPSSPYYLEDNGQVKTITLISILLTLPLCTPYRSCALMILKNMHHLLTLSTPVLLKMLVVQ